jgi:hypothetical protein
MTVSLPASFKRIPFKRLLPNWIPTFEEKQLVVSLVVVVWVTGANFPWYLRLSWELPNRQKEEWHIWFVD